jgi:hypothetical protein
MTAFPKFLLAALAGVSLLAATASMVEARQRFMRYDGPIYLNGPYGGGGYYRVRRGYYGSEFGRTCDPEILGHITRYSCAYRYW